MKRDFSESWNARFLGALSRVACQRARGGAKDVFALARQRTSPVTAFQFKKVGGGKWSLRIGAHYRAVGKFESDGFVRDWIGTHADYDRLV